MRRAAAALAAASTVLGAGLLITAVVVTRRGWFGGYVSEAGVAGAPHASTYGLGIVGLATGLVLVGLALARIVPLAAGLLVAAGTFVAVSGSVSCSAGCPLPPHESPTVADLVHGGASMLAVGACTLAILVVAHTTQTSLRGLSRFAACLVVPLVAAVGLAMLVLGRGQLTALLERLVLLATLGWTVLMGVRLATGHGVSAPIEGHARPAREPSER